jgi:hypothetical protein
VLGRIPRYGVPLLVALCATAATTGAAGEEPDPRQVLNRAKAAAGSISKQADALVDLAWGHDDALVRAAARDELVKFGSHALPALRRALPRVDPLFQGDVTATLIEARRRNRSGNPPDYMPALDEAIWFGSVEARRLAIIELSRYPFPPAVLTTIDAVHEFPELTLTGLRALGRMRNERARFFLRRVLLHGEPRYQRVAAQALGLVGETGIPVLRELLAASEPSVREAAVFAFLPYATPDDIAALREYVGLHDGDDPAVLDAIRERVLELEAAIGGPGPADDSTVAADPASPS